MSRAKTHHKTRAPARTGLKARTLGTRPFFTGKNLNALLCILLAGATVALYSPVFGYGFVVYDDRGYVTANPHIQEGLSWSTVQWAFKATQEGHWHPLTWLSHALDYQLFALNPAGHHLDSVLIHAVNAVLLFLLLAWTTKRVGPSLLAGALFAVHPLNVESVAWVAERKNVLSTSFFLLAIGAYVRYAQRPNWRRYALVASLFAAGLLAKPSVIVLPFVLLLLDYWPLERTSGSPASVSGAPQFGITRLLLEKVPLLVLVAASALATVMAQHSGTAVYGLHPFPLPVRIENAVVSYGLYLWKMLWPARLIALYPYPASLFPPWQVALSGLILAGITVVVVIFRRKRYLLVGWLWFLGTLIPVIGLVQIVGDAARADRYAYIPLIGIFVVIAWSADDLAVRAKLHGAWRVIPPLCVLMVFGFVTHRQMSYWASEYDLWAHALKMDDRNLFAHHFLAEALLNPDSSMTQRDLEGLDTAQEREEEARQHFEAALGIYRQVVQQNPGPYLEHMATTLDNLGNLDVAQKRTEEGRQHFEEALQIQRQLMPRHQVNPFYFVTTLNLLGSVYLQQNRLDDAHRDFEEALRIQRQMLAQHDLQVNPSSFAATLTNLAGVEIQQNLPEEARRHFEAAVTIYRPLAQQNPALHLPNLAMALKNLGNVERSENRIDESRVHYQQALAILQTLSQGDTRYAGDEAEVAAILRELDNR